MFVKKDLRKIPIILQDAMDAPPQTPKDDNTNNDNNNNNKEESKTPLTELRLARRPTEFKQGTIQNVLCQPKYIPAMTNLVSISLYDCNIHNLDGIGFFASNVNDILGNNDQKMMTSHEEKNQEREGSSNSSSSTMVVCPNLQELNLGRNPIKILPSELGLLSPTLKSLWLDDCQIEGPLPSCLYQLEHLEMLRLSNNQITELNDDKYDKDGDEIMEGNAVDGNLSTLGVSHWKKMEVLCLDGNNIEYVPKSLIHLTKLKSLLLRKNKIKNLPEGVPGSTHPNLTLLHLSSNQLKTLPQSLNECQALETIYVNGNQIESISENLFCNEGVLPSLKLVNLSNNELESLSLSFVERFGKPNVDGVCDKDANCRILLEQNQLLLD